ncbi:MAG: hydrogenase 3 maturation endopeptidase HyCI [Methanospirillaceae archaeon]|nr:hydrogenase 3 maturation endopeptidase HyCI [Methanospirillaceae archaeon]
MTDLLLGIGNPLASDDKAGLIVAELVYAAAGDRWTVILAYTAPENFTGQIRNVAPDLLVIIDAADMGLSPGAIRTVSPSLISDAGWGTHQSSLSTLTSFLAPACKEIVIIGIQVLSRDFGETVSPRVQTAAHEVAESIIRRTWSKFLPYLP